MIPNAVEVRQIITLASQAGQMALRHFYQPVTIRHKPNDTFVTQVDLDIEQLLTNYLKKTFPNDSLISEEGTRSKIDHLASRLWAIDPLDGTTAFVQKMPGWGIAIGLLEQGRPAFGLFYMPLFHDLTYTDGSDKVCHNVPNLSGTVRTDWGDKGFLAINASAHRDFCFDVRRVCTTGSVGTSLIYTARGTAAAAFIPKARLWDLVAGAAILNRAGGVLRYLSGRPVDYLDLLDGKLAPEPIIAGHPDLLDQLQPAIRLRPPAAVRL